MGRMPHHTRAPYVAGTFRASTITQVHAVELHIVARELYLSICYPSCLALAAFAAPSQHEPVTHKLNPTKTNYTPGKTMTEYTRMHNFCMYL